MAKSHKPAAASFAARVEIAPGLEQLLCEELAELGISTSVTVGAVEGKVNAMQLLNMQRHSRLASRVTVRMATVGAPNLQGLAERVRKLPWSRFVHPRQPLDVHVTTHESRLKFSNRVAPKVELAIGDALKGPRKPGGKPPRHAQRVIVRIERDKATIRVDASGDLLHRRGWRQDPGRAPLRENLAAAVLRAAGWSPGEALVDPMTGSGTFAVEAALYSQGRPPGEHRSFACETWPCWPKINERPPARTRDLGALIVAADRDERSVGRARNNARRARVDGRIQLIHAPLETLSVDAAQGLVVLNPPWGGRLGDTGQTAKLHHRWSVLLRTQWPGFRVAAVVPDTDWARAAWGANHRVVARFKSGGTAICVLLRTPTGAQNL